ncbi:unnamed protein product [Ectocarpus sp. 4 AP-2014]
MPVGIVSVVGAFRSGKSFLLSWFVRTFEAIEKKEAFSNFIGTGTLCGNGRNNGFSWRGGEKPHTQGMMVWSKPFIREMKDGKGGRTKMAVLLVDTQGMFDHEMDQTLEACLFGLSTTLSSCQIFNVNRHVQADNLDSLAVYLERATATNNSGDGQEGDAQFPRLEVLIRDWQNWKHWDDPIRKDPETLHAKFRDYLDGILAKKTTSNMKIAECFRVGIGCFGLPHPGGPVTSLEFDGKISNIDPGFRKLLHYYIKTVILDQVLDGTILVRRCSFTVIMVLSVHWDACPTTSLPVMDFRYCTTPSPSRHRCAEVPFEAQVEPTGTIPCG